MARWIIGLILLAATHPVSGQVSQGPKRMIFLKETPVLFDMLPDSSFQRFTPALAEIDSADIYLTHYFPEMGNPEKQERKPDNYYRQYAGFFINGKRCIFINASCWLTDYFAKNTWYPRGGGSCYFRALIDLDNKKVLSLLFNAPK
jgi:hypothetical protein